MEPQKSYLVSATPRSGSTLFCELLNATNVAGHPKEYFEMLNETGLPRQPQQYFESTEHKEILELLKQPELRRDATWLARWSGEGYTEYLNQVLAEGTTPNGVFSTKMMWGYFDHFLRDLMYVSPYSDQNTHQILTKTFPNLHYIWVTRQNKESQVVSLWKAIQTQRWRKDTSIEQTDEGATSAQELVFHFGALQHLERQIRLHEARWQHYFEEHGIEPLVIIYEDLVEEKEATIYRTLDYLGIARPDNLSFTTLPMRRQADRLSEEWVQRYRQLKHEHGAVSQEGVA